MFLGAPTGHAFLLTTARHIIRPAQKGPGPRVSSLRSLHNGGQKRQEILGSPPIVQISTGFLFVFLDGEHTLEGLGFSGNARASASRPRVLNYCFHPNFLGCCQQPILAVAYKTHALFSELFPHNEEFDWSFFIFLLCLLFPNIKVFKLVFSKLLLHQGFLVSGVD